MTKFEFDERTPMHFRNYMNTMMDIHSLLDSHTEYLKQNSDNKNEFDDTDTIYLRSAYMLLSAAWEAFIEDIILDSVKFMVENTTPEKLPKSLRKSIATHIKNDKNELSPWVLSSDNCKDCIITYVEKKIELLNSPKSKNINDIFKEFLNLKITDYWFWDYELDFSQKVSFSKENSIQWVDEFISDRGAIVHGRAKNKNRNIFIFFNIYLRINKIQSIIHNIIVDELYKILNKNIWEKIQYSPDWKPFLKVK